MKKSESGGQAHSRKASENARPPSDEPFATRVTTIRRNALSGYLPLLISTILGVFLTPIFVRSLTSADFGLWSIGLGLIAYLGILDGGVGTAVVTRIGHAGDRATAVQAITRTASSIYAFIGIICVVAALGLAWAAPLLFPGTQDIGQAQLMIVFLGLWQVFNLMLAVPSGALQGSGRYSSFAVYAATSAMALAIAQAVIAVATHNVAMVALATAGGGIGALLLSHAKARQQVTGYSFAPRKPDKNVASNLLRLGWRNAVVYIAGAAGYGSDVVIVGVVGGTRAAAIYTIASRAGQFAITLGRRATESLTGSYANLASSDHFDRMWRLYRRGVQTSLLVYVPLAIVLVGFGQRLLVIWVGPIGSLSYSILVVLAISGMFQVIGYNAFVLVVATENGGRLVVMSVASAVVNLTLSIALTSHIGAIGAAFGSLGAAAVIDGLVLPMVAARICHTTAAGVWRFPARLWLPAGVAATTCWLMRQVAGQSGAAALVGSALTVSAFVLSAVSTQSRRNELASVLGRGST